jgi:hypothetical protein
MGNALNSKRPSNVRRNNSPPPIPLAPPSCRLSQIGKYVRRTASMKTRDASMRSARFRSGERRPLIFFNERTPLRGRVAAAA